MPKFEFTDDEIRAACTELGLPQDSFDDKVSERRKIIDYWGNANIVACPGSGKTTVLLVKLLLLSKRMPFDDGSGICVLTHTNVAIDEIKHRLGNKADILFEHPNFFGTTQSFVNKFMGTPAFRTHHITRQHKLKLYDDEFSRKIKRRGFYDLGYGKNGSKTACNYLYGQANRSTPKDATTKEKSNNTLELLYSLNFSLLDETIQRKNGNVLLRDKTNTKYKEILKILTDAWKEGYLCHNDTYNFAEWYIRENKEKLCYIMSERFQMVFFDEMQDSTAQQIGIIESILTAKPVKLYFGDPDQAIYSHETGSEPAWSTDRQEFEKLPISDSKRFDQTIADCINPFKTELESIKGRDTKSSLKPLIILYNAPSEAIDLFIDQIKAHRLEGIEPQSKQAAKFNLVGHTGKDDSKSEKSIISSYAPNYSKSAQQPKFHFDNLVSYFQKRPSSELDCKGTRIYYELFSNALTETLNIAQGSNHSRATLFAQLNDQNPEFLEQFRQASFTWIKGIEQKGLLPIEAKLEFLNFLSKNGYTIPRHNSFFTDNEIKPVDALRADSNIIVKDGIEIKAGTIHSVKGETHVATMLVETENHKKGESDYFWQGEEGTKLFCGNTYKRPDKSFDRLEKIMKTTYVAMSRPTHLLCVAVPKAKAGCPTCPPDKKAKCNWNIIES